MTKTPIAVASPRDQIIEKSRRVVLGYAAGREFANPYSSLSTLLRQMQREYEGRFLYELIQNAYDAHPTDAKGNIVVLLDLDEGEFGVLYVANGGMPFREENFAAICELAQSDKAPDESIGNKGVGFKSVLQVCQWPEIYSAHEPGQEHFEGYCFTFARLDQYDDLANGDVELAAKMREDLAPYFLPVPIDLQPPHVLEFASRGLATVIRLPIKSALAREVVIERIDRLIDNDVPVHLFLERLRELEIIRLDAASGSLSQTLLRDSTAIENPADDPDQRYEHVDLGNQGQWFIASRRMPAQAMRDAILESITEGQLDTSWASWSHDAWVSVAARTDGHEVRPRLYTFLPMEREATAPLHGHIHAPFSTMLARKAVNEDLLLNARLLDCAARASTEAFLAFRENDDVLPEVTLVDLLAWDEDHHDRVTQSFVAAGAEMDDLEIVPIEALPGGRRRGAFSNTYVWSYSQLALLDQKRLARDAGAALVSSTIIGHRLQRLENYCRNFFNEGFVPDGPQRAEWIESVAKELHAHRSAPRTWDRFYDDIAQVFDGDADALHGRAILLGDDGELHASSPEDESKDHPFVFFPASHERTDEDDEVEGDIDLKPPATLNHALVRMNEKLKWTMLDVHTRRYRSTPARKFLEDNKLVRRFKTLDLLEHVGRALTTSQRADLSRDALRFAFSLFVATRSVRQVDLRALGLRVPTRGGWRPATDAVFSRGWETPLASSLSELIERVTTASTQLAAVGDLLLKEPADWPTAIDDRDRWRTFLTEIGVRDGLWPRLAPHGEDPFDGGELEPRSLARRYGLAAAEAERWAGAVTVTPGWKPDHPQTPYRPRLGVAILPGQADYEALDHRARVLLADLVAAGLGSWPSGVLEIDWYRFRHLGQPDDRRWPSPLAVFLRETLWLPVSDPGQRRDESFVAPRDAWYFAESRGDELPYFSPLVVGHLRRQIAASDQVLSRLKQVGMGDWNAASDSPRLLRHLAGLVENNALPETGVLAFRRAYQDAWARAATVELDRFVEATTDLPVVVSCSGQLMVLRPSDGSDARLYLLEDRASLGARILEASDLPILNVGIEDAERLRVLLSALFRERLFTVDKLSIDVITDLGTFTPDGSGELLIEGGWRWLDTLIALILETKRVVSGQLGPVRRREVGERFRRVRRLNTGVLELRVSGVAVTLPEVHRSVVPIDDERYPTLIVALHTVVSDGGLEELIALARPLCELLGTAQFGDPLLLALERLNAQHCLVPTNEDFARVLEIDTTRIAEIRSHLGSSVDGMLRLLVPFVAYQVDERQALALLDMSAGIETEDDLRSAIAEVAPLLPGVEKAFSVSRRAESPSNFRDVLGLDYARFNAALRALAPTYQPIQNREGHVHEMAHYVQVNRLRLLHELRRRNVTAFRDRAPLNAYVAARELDITPDPTWLDACDLPSEQLMQGRALAWLDEQAAPSEDATELPNIDEARAENHGLVVRIAEVATRLVPAWARKQRAPLPEVWAEDAPEAHIVSLANDAGFLDFELLDEAVVLAWIGEHGWWPGDMPRTLVPSELGLEDTDLKIEEDEQARARQERLRQRRVLRLDGIELSAESKDYLAIFKHVTETLREDLLSTSRAARLEEMTESKTSGSGGGSGGTGRRYRADTMSDIQKSAIGLVGETIAYAWLQRHYPGECSPASWVSSYRETIGEPPGNDSLGYDFKIVLKQTTLYFEVKATTGTDTRFELGETEIAKAADCARRRSEDYRIIFISNASDAAVRRLHVLHNPRDPRYQRFYRFPGAGLVCAFNLAS